MSGESSLPCREFSGDDDDDDNEQHPMQEEDVHSQKKNATQRLPVDKFN